MIVIERTVWVDRPVAEVFAYLSDFTTTTLWDPGTVSTVKLSGDGGPGTTYRNTSTFAGRQTELIYVVQERTWDQRFVLHGENSTVLAVDSMSFRDTAPGTEVRYRAEFTLKGLARVAEPFLRGRFAHLGDAAQQGLQDAVEKL